MYRNSDGNGVLYSGTLNKSWVWVILAVFLGLGGIWGYDWASQCYGRVGQFKYRDEWKPFFGGSAHIRPFDFLHGHSLGMLWLRDGQSVLVSYQADFKGKGNYASIWFGPLEEYALHKFRDTGFYRSKSYQTIRNGTGSFVFSARKTGFHVIYHFSGAVNGEFTVSWRAL